MIRNKKNIRARKENISINIIKKKMMSLKKRKINQMVNSDIVKYIIIILDSASYVDHIQMQT